MGIKFHCPNGHKLNVKSFLAGKKGVCPKCGTKVRIPASSEPGLGDGDDDEPGEMAVATAGANGSHPVAAALPAVNATPSISPASSPGSVTVPRATAVSTPAPAAPAAAMTVAGDPIAEAPSAIWYVRPPTGGQYGPARGEIFRRWMAEGRVSADSLVWREGWSDWRSAGQLFPELASAGTSTPAAAIQPAAAVAAIPTASSTYSAKSSTRYRSKKSGGNGVAIAALVFLALVCVALVVVLGFVLLS